MTLDVMTGWVIIAAIAAFVVIYGICAAARGAAAERRIKHEEFRARLPLEHQERLSSISANRDVEMAKSLKAEPKPMIMIEGKGE